MCSSFHWTLKIAAASFGVSICRSAALPENNVIPLVTSHSIISLWKAHDKGIVPA